MRPSRSTAFGEAAASHTRRTRVFENVCKQRSESFCWSRDRSARGTKDCAVLAFSRALTSRLGRAGAAPVPATLRRPSLGHGSLAQPNGFHQFRADSAAAGVRQL